MNKTIKSILYLALCGLITLTLFSCASTDELKPTTGTISVSGSGVIATSPDMATFSVSFSNTAPTSKEAQSAVNEAMQKVYDILINNFDVKDKDIRTTSMSLSPKYKWTDGEQTKVGEEAYQSISVKVYDIKAIGSIVDSLSEVSGVSVSSVNLGLRDENRALMEARVKAMEDALSKAKDYASTAHMTVGKAISISDTSGSPYMYSNYSLMKASAVSMDSMSAGATYYQSDVKVNANVQVTFEIL